MKYSENLDPPAFWAWFRIGSLIYRINQIHLYFINMVDFFLFKSQILSLTLNNVTSLQSQAIAEPDMLDCEVCKLKIEKNVSLMTCM